MMRQVAGSMFHGCQVQASLPLSEGRSAVTLGGDATPDRTSLETAAIKPHVAFRPTPGTAQNKSALHDEPQQRAWAVQAQRLTSAQKVRSSSMTLS